LKTKSKNGEKCTAPNERFGAMAGVAPHKRQCEFGSFAPARTAVSPPLRQAAAPLWASIQQSNEIIGKNNFYCQNIAIFVSKY